MNRTFFPFILFTLLLHAVAAAAQGGLEIIPLKHRSAEQVIPVLRPLMDPGSALSGQGYQLIVRTSPHNLAQVRKTLAAIDLPLRRLLISVRFESTAASSGSGIRMGGTMGSGDMSLGTRHFANEGARSGGRTHLDVRTSSSRNASDEQIDQRVQVLEGGRAFIATGRSQPLQQRRVIAGPAGTMIEESTVMQDANTGFAVVPRVSGNTVFLEISPQRESFVNGADPAASSTIKSQRVSSSLSARLGEWVELGAATQSGARQSAGVLSSRESSTGASSRVWVMVEELRP